MMNTPAEGLAQAVRLLELHTSANKAYPADKTVVAFKDAERI